MMDSNYGSAIVGPQIEKYFATVDGYKVPHLEIVQTGETTWNLIIGGVGHSADHKEALRLLPFLAHAMAYAAGYSSFGEHCEIRNDYKCKVMMIEEAA